MENEQQNITTFQQYKTFVDSVGHGPALSTHSDVWGICGHLLFYGTEYIHLDDGYQSCLTRHGNLVLASGERKWSGEDHACTAAFDADKELKGQVCWDRFYYGEDPGRDY